MSQVKNTLGHFTASHTSHTTPSAVFQQTHLEAASTCSHVDRTITFSNKIWKGTRQTSILKAEQITELIFVLHHSSTHIFYPLEYVRKREQTSRQTKKMPSPAGHQIPHQTGQLQLGHRPSQQLLHIYLLFWQTWQKTPSKTQNSNSFLLWSIITFLTLKTHREYLKWACTYIKAHLSSKFSLYLKAHLAKAEPCKGRSSCTASLQPGKDSRAEEMSSPSVSRL